MQNAPMLPPGRAVHLFLRVKLAPWVPVFTLCAKTGTRERTAKTFVRLYLSSVSPKDLNHALWKTAGYQPLDIIKAKDNQKSHKKGFGHTPSAEP